MSFLFYVNMPVKYSEANVTISLGTYKEFLKYEQKIDP